MANTLKPDREQVRRFLDMLGNVGNDYFDFRLINEKDKANNASNTRGTLTMRSGQLITKQNMGYGAFVIINESDGNGFKDEHIVKVRFVFLDLDKPGQPWKVIADALQPHMIVESSPGKHHLYWRVSDCEVGDFKHIQKALAKKYVGDESICNPSRVMRLPGFWHLKCDPVLTALKECYPDLPTYTVAEIKSGLGLTTAQETVLKDTLRTHETIPEVTSKSVNYEITNPETGEVVDLGAWAALNRSLNITGLLKEHSPEHIRGELRSGKQHIRCPFEDQHSEQSMDTATFVANRSKDKTDSFVIHCMHSHCADRDRIEFLSKMFSKGWLPISLLTAHQSKRRPLWVNYPLNFMSFPDWAVLDGCERRIALDLLRIAWTMEEGTLPDNDFMLSRHLSIPREEWEQHRANLKLSGWLITGNGRIWNSMMLEEYQKAASAYYAKVAGGKKGRQKRDDDLC